ncbi:MAG: DNA-binding domain-containing protein [Thiolinea sp.]
MALEQLQQQFVQAIFGGDRQAIAAKVQAQGKLDALQRVGIYRNSVHGTLCKYLASLYPVCAQLLGEKFFAQLSDAYIDANPPASPFLPEYGGGMADFMHSHASMQSVRWIAEMARLEWSRHRAWHGVNQPVADFSRLATLSEQQQAAVCFQLPGSAQLLNASYALHAVWLAHQAEAHADKLPLEQIELHQACHLLIWRAGRSLHQVELSAIQSAFLQAVQQASTLSELGEQFQEQLPGLLTTAIQRGWVTGLSVG